MLEIIYWIVLLINIFLLFLKRKPKSVLIIDFIFVFILFYGTTTNNDYNYYVLMYEQGINRTVYEVGFNLILDVIKITGLSFQGFIGMLWVVFGGLILHVFMKYTKNYPLFFTCYLIYIVFVDITQLKSFCASAVLLYALYFYSVNKRMLFIFFDILAATIHIEMLFFLPLVFFNNNMKSHKFFKRCAQAIIATCVIFFFFREPLNSLIESIGTLVISILGNTEKSGYFITQSNYGFLVYFALHIAAIIATYNVKRKSGKCMISQETNKIKQLIETTELIQFYCLFSFPLIMMNMNFYRLYRVTIYFNFIAWATILDTFVNATIGYYKCIFTILLANIIYRIPIIQGNDQIDIILNNNSIIRGK